MIEKLLVANRGEIVARVIRTCRRLGIASVAVYSEADRNLPYLREADETVSIGPANPVKSYLNIEAILDAAKRSGADAVHPGYGFLSENARFARAVSGASLTWVGPPPEVLEAIDSKCTCRRIAVEAGVPVIPGTAEPVESVDGVLSFAREHGYPFLLKLDRGGGGKGLETVREEGQAREAYERMTRIGVLAFGSPESYIEKLIDHPRHIEVQFLADASGSCVCLGERECSVQRRYQKIIEESPSPVVKPEDRETLFRHTTALVKAMRYRGAGTMEFLRSPAGGYYFMEVNARLQVEHPVTEMIVGMDIVAEQLGIAAGETLRFRQEDVRFAGHAVEARVYAEDPETFCPSPGTIERLRLPATGGDDLRIDHALEEGCAVPPYYDPLLAKVIARGGTRREAVERLRAALEEFEIEGIRTTVQTNLAILSSQEYLAGDYDTGFLDRLLMRRAGTLQTV